MNGNMQFQRLLEMIFRALEGERTAAMFYDRMVGMATDFDTKEAFAEARRDERQHVVEISELIRDLTGVEPPNTIGQVASPINILEGLRLALAGEESDIAFYTNIVNMAGIESIRSRFKEIREDERVHAEKFRTLIQMMQGMNRQNGTNGTMPTQSPMG